MWTKAVIGVLVLAAVITYVASSAIPDRHDKRTKEQELSDEPHDKDGMHNDQYDHEAFLGKEEAKKFEQLQPEESKLRLAKIVSEKIDQNHDGFVTEDEMIRWIKYIQRRYAADDALRQWKDHNVKDGKINWQSYKERVFGPGDEHHSAGGYNYKEMMERDKRRFNMADTDNDDALSLDEFTNFLHPEEADHMRDIVVLETMEDIDKNKDGYIEEAEYIGDMWPSDKTEPEPDWVKTEREHFKKWRDTNQDGRMDKDEVKHWIMPEDYDHAMAESKHLIHESDADKDGQLTKDEILAKYDLFVGSQATDFGEALVKSHDEF